MKKFLQQFVPDSSLNESDSFFSFDIDEIDQIENQEIREMVLKSFFNIDIDKICEIMKETAKELSPDDEYYKNRPDWFTSRKIELLSCIESRNSALMSYTANTNGTNKSNLTCAKNTLRNEVQFSKTD